ncbi:MAG: radical SAM protein, partial [Deltaproteobacteria bacterium]|nr:radical SAM protein [Deltaproteobacteria bacterium]
MKKAKRFINQINRYSLAHLRTGHYSKIARFALNKTRALFFGYPHHLMIEPTLECNIKCPLCPTPQSRNPRRFLYGSMPIETFRKIIDNSKDVIFRVHLTTFGEPLLNEDLHLMIRYLTDNGIISMISTNATLLTKNKVEQLIDAGLDYLIISFDGFSPKSYESFRVGADFKKTLANIDT